MTHAELLPYDGHLPIEYPLLIYWENTGRLKVRARNSLGTISPRIETITIDSAAGIFEGELTVVPSGVRKPSEHTIVGERVGPLGLESFDVSGVALPKMTEDFLLADLSVRGELTDGEEFGPVDSEHRTMLDYYPGIRPGGVLNDQHVSIVYRASDGVVSVDVPPDNALNSLVISSDSAAGIFTKCAISGNIDPCGHDYFFHGVFGPDIIGSMSFGSIMEPGLAEEFLLNDLSVVGGMVTAAGSVGFRDADLIYIPVPEPSTFVLLSVGIVLLAARRQHRPAAERPR